MFMYFVLFIVKINLIEMLSICTTFMQRYNSRVIWQNLF